jgi:hypothetical protein
MVKVFFPPGCYGTYVTRCIYNYTNLRNEPFVEFTFSDTGNSHQHWNNMQAILKIQQGHIKTLSYTDNDVVVSILPCKSHRLDYYNNQFFKQQHGKLIEYILTSLSLDKIEHKLATHWNYNGKFDKTVPRCIMREWCSLWINDALEAAYNPLQYQELNSVAQLTTQDIFENYKTYKEKANRQAYYSRTNFSWDKMVKKLDTIFINRIPEFPKEVKLELPKLQLPKLEKING